MRLPASTPVAALAVVGVLTVGFVVTAALPARDTSDAGSVPPPADRELDAVAPDAGQPRLQRIATRLFARRAHALLAGDRVTFMQQIDSADPEFRRRQAMLFDNAQRVPFAEFSYAITAVHLPSESEAYGVPTFVPWTRVQHRLAGYDSRPLSASLAYTLVRRAEGWRIASDTDVQPPDRRREPWDLAPLRVHDDGSLLVITDADQERRLQRAVRLSRRALATIDRTLSFAWPRRAVIYALTDRTLIEEYPGSDFAAITVALGGGARVLVNLDARNLNAGVVTHEITHLAINDYWRAPMWLHEGIATYVETREYTPQYRFLYARDFARRARAEPEGLPGSTSFASHLPGARWSYVLSWMACEYVATVYGMPRLLKVIQAMDAREGVTNLDAAQDEVLTRVLGITGDELAERAAAHLLRTYAYV